MRTRFVWHIGDDHGESETITMMKQHHLNYILKWLPRWVRWVMSIAVLIAVCTTVLTVHLRHRDVQNRLRFQIQNVIDLEGRAFAEGNVDLFLAQQDRDVAEWYKFQGFLIEAGHEWPDGPEAFPLSVLPAEIQQVEVHGDSAWVEIVEGTPAVRRMRFYRRTDLGWLHTGPDLAFWGSEIRLDAGDRLTFHYHERDWPHVAPLVEQLERDMSQVCATMGCPPHLTLTVAIDVVNETHGDIALPSPWVSGIPVDGSSWASSVSPILYPGESIQQAVLHALVDRIASERFQDKRLWQGTPLSAILEEYVVWLSHRDPTRLPLLGRILAQHGEEALPAVFDSLSRGPSTSEFLSEWLGSGCEEQKDRFPDIGYGTRTQTK